MRPDGRKAIVFLVDDDENMLEQLSELLESENYLVLTARDGREALARMKGFSGPAVALIDLLMPEMNGWQLIEAMKNDAALKKIPIIVCSGYREVPIYGADWFVRKPAPMEELTLRLREALDLRK